METYTTRSGKVLALVLCQCGQVAVECDPSNWEYVQAHKPICLECETDRDELQSMAWMGEDE
jgi:hypothetical protein